MGGRDRAGVDAALGQRADMVDDAVTVEFALLVASGGYGRAAKELKFAVTRRLELGLRLLCDALDIAQGEETVQMISSSTTRSLLIPGWSVKN